MTVEKERSVENVGLSQLIQLSLSSTINELHVLLILRIIALVLQLEPMFQVNICD